MEAKIVESLISAKPKAGFFVITNGEKKKIEEINGDVVVLEDGNEISYAAASNAIVRYTAKINEKEFQVLYDDYHRISDEQICEGFVVDRFRNAHEGDIIRITDINVIDEHGLHDIKDRKGEIIRQIAGNKFKQEYEITLATNRKLFKLQREQFTLLDDRNTKKFFHPRCNFCKQ